ncbi:hypothetical protein AOQ84DRAFT_331870 [Glonium stellatum]|uniref:Impact N-terminal domain-containing protein n=1 Tax=Glonium stellatum TaxID=574774 RepID=A0A8E2FC77_9PEZI|nr:hypothetical protein AOQ84DRAFT_331870 [Glonium stellatum]
MSQKRALSPSPSSSASLPIEIFRSAPIEDRSSVFVGAYSLSLSAKALQGLPDFKTASHRIAAWRKPSRQRSILPKSEKLYDTGYDDDGERYGGKRLEKMLGDMNIEGSVVVARWYGGTMLGPIRFNHIEACAKEAIQKWKAAAVEIERAEAQKRQKMEDDAKRRYLEETLRERDQSIFVLRGLLADKSRGLGSSGPVVETAPPTPKKPISYSNMPIEALRRLDKARDATIAFILKEIDKVEERQKALKDLKTEADHDHSVGRDEHEEISHHPSESEDHLLEPTLGLKPKSQELEAPDNDSKSLRAEANIDSG